MGREGGPEARRPPFPRRIRRVNRWSCERLILITMSKARFAPVKPREMFRTTALTGLAALIAALSVSLAPPARAQIGTIFSDPPPRPPASAGVSPKSKPCSPCPSMISCSVPSRFIGITSTPMPSSAPRCCPSRPAAAPKTAATAPSRPATIPAWKRNPSFP